MKNTITTFSHTHTPGPVLQNDSTAKTSTQKGLAHPYKCGIQLRHIVRGANGQHYTV